MLLSEKLNYKGTKLTAISIFTVNKLKSVLCPPLLSGESI